MRGDLKAGPSNPAGSSKGNLLDVLKQPAQQMTSATPPFLATGSRSRFLPSRFKNQSVLRTFELKLLQWARMDDNG